MTTPNSTPPGEENKATQSGYELAVRPKDTGTDGGVSYALSQVPNKKIEDMNVPGREPEFILGLSQNLDLALRDLRSPNYLLARENQAMATAMAAAVQERTLKDISPETLSQVDPEAAVNQELRAIRGRVAEMQRELSRARREKNDNITLKALSGVVRPSQQSLQKTQADVATWEHTEAQLKAAGYKYKGAEEARSELAKKKKEYSEAELKAFETAEMTLDKVLEQLEDKVHGTEATAEAAITAEEQQGVLLFDRSKSSVRAYLPQGNIDEIAEGADVEDLITHNTRAIKLFAFYTKKAQQMVAEANNDNELLVRAFEAAPGEKGTGGFGPLFNAEAPKEVVTPQDNEASFGQKAGRQVSHLWGGAWDILSFGTSRNNEQAKAVQAELKRRAGKIRHIADHQLPKVLEALQNRKDYLEILKLKRTEVDAAKQDTATATQRLEVMKQIKQLAESRDVGFHAIERSLGVLKSATKALKNANEAVKQVYADETEGSTGRLFQEAQRLRQLVVDQFKAIAQQIKDGFGGDVELTDKRIIQLYPEGLLTVLKGADSNTLTTLPSSTECATWVETLGETISDRERQRKANERIAQLEGDILAVLENEFIPEYRKVAARIHTTKAKEYGASAEGYLTSFEASIAEIRRKRSESHGNFVSRMIEFNEAMATAHRSLTALLEIAASATQAAQNLTEGLTETTKALPGPSAEETNHAMVRVTEDAADEYSRRMQDRLKAAEAGAGANLDEAETAADNIGETLQYINQTILPWLRGYKGSSASAMEQQRASLSQSRRQLDRAEAALEPAEQALVKARAELQGKRAQVEHPDHTVAEEKAMNDPTNSFAIALAAAAQIEREIELLEAEVGELEGIPEDNRNSRQRILLGVKRRALGTPSQPAAGGETAVEATGKYKDMEEALEKAHQSDGLQEKLVELRQSGERELKQLEENVRKEQARLETLRRQIEFEGRVLVEKTAMFMTMRAIFRTASALEALSTTYVTLGNRDLKEQTKIFAGLRNPKDVDIESVVDVPTAAEAKEFFDKKNLANKAQYDLFREEEEEAALRSIREGETGGEEAEILIARDRVGVDGRSVSRKFDPNKAAGTPERVGGAHLSTETPEATNDPVKAVVGSLRQELAGTAETSQVEEAHQEAPAAEPAAEEVQVEPAAKTEEAPVEAPKLTASDIDDLPDID